MRRVLACSAAIALSACLFPSLDGLTDGGATDATAEAGFDATPDVATNDASDAGADVTIDAGMCPPNSDPSLVAYYPFDEGSGTIVHDCSGHGYDALLGGTNAASSWTSGHAKGAIAFASANQICVVVASASANQSGGALTISAWYRMPSSSGGGYIVGQRHQTGVAWRVDVEQTDAGNVLGFAVGLNDGTGNDVEVTTLTSTGTYHHVAAVYDPNGPTQTLYYDGASVDSKAGAPAIVLDPIASTIRIGCRADDTNFFDGVIDEVRVYSRALGASEIAALAK